jgi:threonine aldolase
MILSVIDLKSDTVTKPGEDMRKAMASAEVGDDVYMEDPTVRALEAKGAELTGKEDALFVASGTMGNLVSILTHCDRGDGAVLGFKSHIYYYEGGGLSVLGGIVPLIADDAKGIPETEDIRFWLRPKNVHYAPARLLCLENTHNRCGGIAVDPDSFARVADFGKENGLAVHLDGARIFNASIAYNVPATAFTDKVDSVQICLSKGLGAPVGSLVCADSNFVDRARSWRKKVGGGMRQAGIIAAGGLYALKNNVKRLADDHENASILAEKLSNGGLVVESEGKRTNMVFFGIGGNGEKDSAFLEACSKRGVQFNGVGKGHFRLVTHINVDREQVVKAAEVILEEAGSCR